MSRGSASAGFLTHPHGIIEGMNAQAVLTPLDAAVEPVRVRWQGLLTELREWALARGRPVDRDVAALIFAVAEETGDGPLGRWTRPGVNSLLCAGLGNWCSTHRCLRPELERETLWDVLTFLDATGRLHEHSDALLHLLEPLRCYGGLDADGRLPTEPVLPDFPCQCFLDVVA